MVTVTVSETYDLSTKKDRMSIIGIHTPSMEIIRKSFPGLLVNSRMMKLLYCDVRLACASVLPADPQQIGVEAGDIAPQDMFNPILYKAVSNQGMNVFENRMHGLARAGDPDQTHGQSLDKSDVVFGDGASDDFDIYYSLLANHQGFKVAHPQRGLVMSHLRPFVYEKLYNMGDAGSHDMNDLSGVVNDTTYGIAIENSKDIDYGKALVPVQAFRGRPRPMPAFSTMVMNSVTQNNDVGLGGGTKYQNTQNPIQCYCGMILMPPSKLNVFYYRLVIRWHIAFFGIRPINDIVTPGTMRTNASVFYGSDYFPLSKNAENDQGMVDVRDGNITKIMEGI